MPRFEDSILRKILPSPEEDRRIQGVVRDVMRILETKIAAKGLAAKPLLVGSVAKGVHLTGTEIDIFVTFPPDTPREVLEREGLALGDVLERPVRMYAEHPYTRGWYGGFEVEIVPCYRITDATQRMSAVDRTPLHVDYVLGQAQEGTTTPARPSPTRASDSSSRGRCSRSRPRCCGPSSESGVRASSRSPSRRRA